MKRLMWATAGTLGILLLASGCVAEDKKIELKDQNDKVSYAIGLSMGRDFEKQEIEVVPAIIAKGIKDGLSGAEALMTDEEIKETQLAFQEEVVAKQTARVENMKTENKEKGEAFLAENKEKEGVVTLESGLQYKVIEEGTGATPKVSETVTVNYKGTLIDGTEFDSSYKRGEPVSFPVGGVIPGWTEALQLMKEGAKWQLFIPATLAYGERGAGNVIQPNSALVFDVELLYIGQKKPKMEEEEKEPVEEAK
ncbi:MAG: hypothetical protein C0617_14365 [Desulfuromonas sp.]|uniref:FKBP-type peptidyl-prolyl cis-trans isomerase n=1 Tax=Desulfuromonas sp. TaxID=892 RepID=UPI000CCAE677|nr:FKBP-type peptidyl-prolyl cis-trans isomerase [Desulfuromonas sp.]PLX82307.1 MAG: hypothetical protein C0617_14365 [Desulfuromonas sp.]